MSTGLGAMRPSPYLRRWAQRAPDPLAAKLAELADATLEDPELAERIQADQDFQALRTGEVLDGGSAAPAPLSDEDLRRLKRIAAAHPVVPDARIAALTSCGPLSPLRWANRRRERNLPG